MSVRTTTSPSHSAWPSWLPRVRAVFRRSDARAAFEPSRVVRAGDIELRPDQHDACVAGRHVTLTPKEFDLLLGFCRAPERVFKRTELLHRVWGHTHDGYLHTVNTHINRLACQDRT